MITIRYIIKRCNMQNWFEQLRATDIVVMLQQLGLTQKGRRWGPAPCCSADRASDKDSRPPVNTINDKLWVCNACGTHGNIFDLISQHIDNKQMEEMNWETIRDWWKSFSPADEDNKELIQNPVQSHKREYPPLEEVENLIDQTILLKDANKKMFNRTRDYYNWMKFREQRHIHDNAPAAFMIPDANLKSLSLVESSRGTMTPWWRPEWRRSFPLIVPLWDNQGILRSLLGRTYGSAVRNHRKTTVPIGYTTENLFLANKTARAWLRKEATPSIIWIVEGEIDFINVALAGKAVIGIRSGSINGLALMPWHRTQKVLIATDNDKAGDKYAHDAAIYCRPAQPMRIKFNEQT